MLLPPSNNHNAHKHTQTHIHTCHVGSVRSGIHDQRENVTPVVHVNPEVKARHIAESAVLPQLKGRGGGGGGSGGQDKSQGQGRAQGAQRYRASVRDRQRKGVPGAGVKTTTTSEGEAKTQQKRPSARTHTPLVHLHLYAGIHRCISRVTSTILMLPAHSS